MMKCTGSWNKINNLPLNPLLNVQLYLLVHSSYSIQNVQNRSLTENIYQMVNSRSRVYTD